MDRSVVLQCINGYLSVTVACACALFLRYFITNRHLGYSQLRPAIALIVLCAFEAVLRFPVFIVRTLVNMGIEVAQPNVTLVIGGIGVEAAFLCVCQVFGPKRWKYWNWIVPFLLSTIVVGLSLLIIEEY